MELVFDSPGHVRLPINDDEIIDRVLAIQPPAGRPVTLLTYDTGQSMRARTAGLPVRNWPSPWKVTQAHRPPQAATAAPEALPAPDRLIMAGISSRRQRTAHAATMIGARPWSDRA